MKTLLKFFITLSILFASGVLAQTSNKLLPDELNTIHIFKNAKPAVVYVRKLRRVKFSGKNTYVTSTGSGSGIAWDTQGHIVTNYHLVYGTTRLAITFSNGKTLAAKFIGADERNDIAVLKVNTQRIPQFYKTLQPYTVANSSHLLVGQKAVAIGNPYGLSHSLSTGVISALTRRVKGFNGIVLRDMIQTDAAINPGNSGGPLLDSQGQLIGMNTAIVSKSGSFSGIGFAIPSNSLNRVVGQIIKHGHVIQPGLGIHVFDDQTARSLGIKGVLIAEVTPGTPAANAGLRPTYWGARGQLQLGDRIIAINGRPLKRYDDLHDHLSRMSVGDAVSLTIIRNTKTLTVKMKTIDLSKQ